MNDERAIGEADLHAYIDGELDADARADVEAWLAGHPDDAARLEAYRAQRDALHAAFDPVLDEPVPAAMTRALSAPPRPSGPPAWMRMAAALALLIMGGAGGWLARGLEPQATQPVSGFVGRAVGAHVVYASEVRHPVEVSADQESHLVGWLSKRLGRTLRAPDLQAGGFSLVGGRLLPDHGVPAAQFMYEDTAGRRVTVYVRDAVEATETAFRFTKADGVSAFYWMDSDLSYALVGETARDDLLRLARAVYDGAMREP